MGKTCLPGVISYYSTWLTLQDYGLKCSDCSFRVCLYKWNSEGKFMMPGWDRAFIEYGKFLGFPYSQDSGNGTRALNCQDSSMIG